MWRRLALLAGLAGRLLTGLRRRLLTGNAFGVAAVGLAVILTRLASTHGGSPLLHVEERRERQWGSFQCAVSRTIDMAEPHLESMLHQKPPKDDLGIQN